MCGSVVFMVACSALVRTPVPARRETLTSLATTHTGDVDLALASNYSDESRFKVRNALLEKALDNTRAMYAAVVEEKAAAEARLRSGAEEEDRLRLKINELAQELNYMANQLLEKVKTSAARENSFMRAIEEGQLNLTRSRIRYEEYRKATDSRLRESSNAMVSLQLSEESARRQNEVLLSRTKILETVLAQLRDEAAQLRDEVVTSRRAEEEARREIDALRDQLVALKSQLQLSSPVAAASQAPVDLEEMCAFKSRLSGEIEQCGAMKDRMQAELGSLRAFIEEARVEYRALVASVGVVSALPTMDSSLLTDTIHLQTGHLEELRLSSSIAENNAAVKQMRAELASLKAQLREPAGIPRILGSVARGVLAAVSTRPHQSSLLAGLKNRTQGDEGLTSFLRAMSSEDF